MFQPLTLFPCFPIHHNPQEGRLGTRDIHLHHSLPIQQNIVMPMLLFHRGHYCMKSPSIGSPISLLTVITASAYYIILDIKEFLIGR